MTVNLWNLAAYSIQLAALVSTAFLILLILRLRVPDMSLRFWQSILLIALLLPLAQPQRGDVLLQVIVESAAFASVTVAGASMVPAGFDAAALVVAVLAAGMILRLAWLGLGLFRLRSIVGRAVSDPTLAANAADLGRALNVSVPIMISDDLEGPATIGNRRPVVLVPRTVLQMPLTVQRAILCHEFLHVKRRDWLHTIAEEIWCAMLWFHPGARVIASRLSLARETVVDEMTIRITRDRRAYAEALLAFSNPQPHLIGATPFIGRHTLSQRISLIAEETTMSRHRALFGFALALTAVLGSTATVVDRFPMSGALHAQDTVYELKPGPGDPAGRRSRGQARLHPRGDAEEDSRGGLHEHRDRCQRRRDRGGRDAVPG